MRTLYKESQDGPPPRLWTDEEIANAQVDGEESKGKKLNDNRHARGKILATSLATAFNQAVVNVTGENLLECDLWYFNLEFQKEYNKLFQEGQAIMTAAAVRDGYNGYANDFNKAKRKMEALMSERQVSPVATEDCAAMNDCLKIPTDNVEIVEEDYDDGEDEENVSNEEFGRRVVEIDCEDMDDDAKDRMAGHLRRY